MDQLAVARQSFDRHNWTECYLTLSAADARTPLDADDLQRLASVAHLLGREPESLDAWTRAYGALAEAGAAPRAARCAFWLAFQLFNAGEHARGGGWLTRAQRLVEGLDCGDRGYVLCAAAHQTLAMGDPAGAYAMFGEAMELGERFGERTLYALATLGRGQAAVVLGRTDEAMGLLDEVMVTVTADEVAPVIAGLAYCAVIIVCQETFDLRRANEWTNALSQWCEVQPDVVAYRGLCLVHRAEVMQLHGAWSDALAEAGRAAERLSDPPRQEAVGMALYVLAELHRLRGEWPEAEDLYRQANRSGRHPQPGLALLRLAEGRVDAATSGIKRALDEAASPLDRAKLLPAAVEVLLAAGDLQAASSAADELTAIAEQLDRPYLTTVAAHSTGAVLLAEGNGRAALTELRTACSGWQELQAPYGVGRARVLLALACRAAGDEEGCEFELDAARDCFEQLGAAPDLARLPVVAAGPQCGLTAREVEVLALLATGATNRAIATELVISEKTVARHVSNIFAKLDLSSRAGATAYAYEHGLA
ncbi:LuxR family transcriptional regulator [Kribbella amoyensis]|uniref:LuxR family transcriptional regulator n=1 Tax=Kribbella amoyensis TaxID=996641 RepID=A0A561BZH8_9ACTN|nr:LuxR family transcriptional regulator [Kribbella amoyensis]TWD84319.1 LuxR family transcriptional regulator [Kribbella amoyensis]